MNAAERTVLLDVDGTLVDSTYHHAIAWGKAFRQRELEPPMWRVHRSIGMGGDRLVVEVCGDSVEERLGDELRELWADNYQAIVDQVVAIPGAREFTQSLGSRGFRVCVASSGNSKDTDHALEIAGIRDLVDAVVTGDDVEKSKPSPEVLEQAWRHAGGGAAVVVGDSVYDIQAAANLDLPCIAVRTGGFGVEELQSEGSVLVVESIADLVDLDLSKFLA